MLVLFEYLDEKNNLTVSETKLMSIASSSEPVCLTIGRKVDCDISFPLDKSISRKHCQLNAYPNGTLTITDLKSSFGTFVNGIKCPPHEELPLSDKTHFKFGNELTNIRIRKFKFCNTRLDKAEKERLKEVCRSIGGEMVKQLEASCHLLCSRYSATVGACLCCLCLCFIWYCRTITSGENIASFCDANTNRKFCLRWISCWPCRVPWFCKVKEDFISSSSPRNWVRACAATPCEWQSSRVLIGQIYRFKPMESLTISNISDPSESRHSLLAGHIVIVLERVMSDICLS